MTTLTPEVLARMRANAVGQADIMLLRYVATDATEPIDDTDRAFMGALNRLIDSHAVALIDKAVAAEERDRLRAELATARDAALEEAARICGIAVGMDGPIYSHECADAIRALKTGGGK